MSLFQNEFSCKTFHIERRDLHENEPAQAEHIFMGMVSYEDSF